MVDQRESCPPARRRRPGAVRGGGQLCDEPRAATGRRQQLRPRVRLQPGRRARRLRRAARSFGHRRLAGSVLWHRAGADPGGGEVAAGRAGCRTALVGVDPVDAFDPAPAPAPNLELICASVVSWAPTRAFDLVTCLHGLHYVGDKLAARLRAAGPTYDPRRLRISCTGRRELHPAVPLSRGRRPRRCQLHRATGRALHYAEED